MISYSATPDSLGGSRVIIARIPEAIMVGPLQNCFQAFLGAPEYPNGQQCLEAFRFHQVPPPYHPSTADD